MMKLRSLIVIVVVFDTAAMLEMLEILRLPRHVK